MSAPKGGDKARAEDGWCPGISMVHYLSLRGQDYTLRDKGMQVSWSIEKRNASAQPLQVGLGRERVLFFFFLETASLCKQVIL